MTELGGQKENTVSFQSVAAKLLVLVLVSQNQREQAEVPVSPLTFTLSRPQYDAAVRYFCFEYKWRAQSSLLDSSRAGERRFDSVCIALAPDSVPMV